MKKKLIAVKQLPDMPRFAREIMKQKNIKPIDIARQLHWHPSTVTQLFKRRNWEIAELIMVGSVLKHDLVQYLYPAPPEGMVPASAVEELMKELAAEKEKTAAFEKENMVLQTENKVLMHLLEIKGKG